MWIDVASATRIIVPGRLGRLPGAWTFVGRKTHRPSCCTAPTVLIWGKLDFLLPHEVLGGHLKTGQLKAPQDG